MPGRLNAIPVAVSAHYLRSPDPGPVEIEAEVRRSGRSASQVRATLIQDGTPRVDALLMMSDLGTADADVAWSRLSPDDDITPLEDCERFVGIMDQLAIYLDPASAGFTTGHPSGRGELRGWLGLPGDEAFDTVSLLLAVDAFPPASFDISFTGWVPTVELTAYLRARPAPGPLRVQVRAELISHGRVDETCRVWDSAGTLVAQATQLAGIRFP